MLDELIDKVIEHIQWRKTKHRKEESLRERWLGDARLAAQDSGFGIIDADDQVVLKAMSDGRIVITKRASGQDRILNNDEWIAYVSKGLKALS
ncbi:MAG: hypothetical protein H7A51_13860 [Akkermansiaceae bacterium]|nr:hypothetical protein [Akkermansiaceae bacterium]MCP5537302.1 hypothetical protein [Akkermansiaceae bacterium]